MNKIEKSKDLFYSLGGKLDSNNYNSSFFNPTGIKKEVPGNFSRIKNFRYDEISLKILETICRKGKIRPQNIDLPGVKISGDVYGNEVFLFSSDNLKGIENFIQTSLSIIIDKNAVQDMAKSIIKESRVYELTPIPVRIKGVIPKKYFKAIGVPITLQAPLWNIKDENNYITRRCEEIEIINALLKEYGIGIPTCDTFTGEELAPSFQQIKKLSKAFIEK